MLEERDLGVLMAVVTLLLGVVSRNYEGKPYSTAMLHCLTWHTHMFNSHIRLGFSLKGFKCDCSGHYSARRQISWLCAPLWHASYAEARA